MDRTYSLRVLICFLATCFACTAIAQTIYLTNPSFEDEPRANKAAHGWQDCGTIFPGETPPDIHPAGLWEVSQLPSDGRSYIGLVVRDNNTWEFIGQKLNDTLKAGKTYRFEADLCVSQRYISFTRTNFTEPTNYNTPVKVRIWGGNEICQKLELLAQSEPVKNKKWRRYTFTLKPESNLSSIILEAFYESASEVPYNGHVLIDHASDLIPISE